MDSSSLAAPERMQCMEVWGGNLAADRALTMPGLQAWLSSEPYEQAEKGGDVYYVSSCASGRITRILLADVSGHGLAVSELAIKLRDLMRGNINMINQTRFVAAMNRQFLDAANDGGFATAVVLTFFAPTQTLQVCNAGHPSPLLYHAADQTWSIMAQPLGESKEGPIDLPLGVLDESDYTRSESQLAPGDAVLCYSDAFSESNDGRGNMLSVEGLLRTVREISMDEPKSFVAELRRRIDAMQPDNLQQDDSTAVLIQADGSGATLGDTLMAPIRIFASPRDRTALRSAT